jgi:hypothetical protein
MLRKNMKKIVIAAALMVSGLLVGCNQLTQYTVSEQEINQALQKHNNFAKDIGVPGVAQELKLRGAHVELRSLPPDEGEHLGHLDLLVHMGDEQNFVYQIWPQQYSVPGFTYRARSGGAHAPHPLDGSSAGGPLHRQRGVKPPQRAASAQRVRRRLCPALAHVATEQPTQIALAGSTIPPQYAYPRH